MDYLILALATWRIASLITYEEGPFEVFERLRTLAGVRSNDYGRYGTNELARGLICLWCCSTWIGALGALTYWWNDSAIWLALPFALSAGAILVDELIGKKDNG